MMGGFSNQNVSCLSQHSNAHAHLDNTRLHITQSLDELKLLQSYRHDNILQVSTPCLRIACLICCWNVCTLFVMTISCVYCPHFNCTCTTTIVINGNVRKFTFILYFIKCIVHLKRGMSVSLV